MTNTATFKKALQKEVGKIRKQIGGAFPKAMMTSQQIEHSTATINCGGERRSVEKTKELAQKVIESSDLTEMIKKNEATARIEYNSATDAWQIRINW